MRSILSIGTLSLALALPVLVSAQSNTPRRPDLNAFIDHKVSDTRSLVNEARNDPAVANRYERHFAMTRQQVLDYLGSLHREPLANTAKFRVYSVPSNGAVKMHYEVLKKGTPIFADPSGHPNLIVKCGNPLVLGKLNAPRANLETIRPAPPLVVDEFLPDLRDATVDMTNLSLDEMPIIPEIAPEVLAGPSSLSAVTSLASAPAFHSVLPWLGIAPLLAPIFGSSHGGGGGNIVVFPTPEPSSFVALGLGAAVWGRRRRKA